MKIIINIYHKSTIYYSFYLLFIYLKQIFYYLFYVV